MGDGEEELVLPKLALSGEDNRDETTLAECGVCPRVPTLPMRRRRRMMIILYNLVSNLLVFIPDHICLLVNLSKYNSIP